MKQCVSDHRLSAIMSYDMRPSENMLNELESDLAYDLLCARVENTTRAAYVEKLRAALQLAPCTCSMEDGECPRCEALNTSPMTALEEHDEGVRAAGRAEAYDFMDDGSR